MTRDPHAGGRVLSAGAPLARARLVMIMLHGRGGAPEDMEGLAGYLGLPDIAIRAPEAAGNSWWPDSFLAPLAANEPGLGSALGVVGRLSDELRREGFGPDRTVILGFSQGACLALEHAARAGTPFACVAGLSGGLVGTGEAGGPPQAALYGHAEKAFAYEGRLDGTPVLLSCHERDPHIPLARVRTTEAVFRDLGAAVTTRIHPGAGHGILEDDISALRAVLNTAG
ncbi:dienelactone hydrolase family protein [Roseovarius sp. SCSIO 43702]|uniref:alpha/beta hydrolase n=1 Tax=Roseovarius sp. SCSIO 43702 TaxID=2823043 RepID=UPI001C733E19|nr:dienelactone hydrolase family protein [Roseovarius sp. SCSIO 43702]QYX57155.1 dienelactone hydrolase family protein [Roseovarius sp. SCSIO 43702]